VNRSGDGEGRGEHEASVSKKDSMENEQVGGGGEK
jgi:hypothetical protein